MMVKINQLDEKYSDITIQRLKEENNKLRKLIEKHRESRNTSSISDDYKAKKVGINYECCSYVIL